MAHLHSDHAQEKTLQQQGAAQAMLLRQGLPTYMRRIVPMTAGWPNLRVWRARVGRYHKLQVRRSSGAQGLDEPGPLEPRGPSQFDSSSGESSSGLSSDED